MTLNNNNFNGGPDGTTISSSNSGQYGDTPFIGAAATGGVLQFTSSALLNRPTAEFVALFSTNSSGSPVYFYWALTATQVWMRVYILFTSVPTTATVDPCLFTMRSATVIRLGVYLRTSTSPNTFYLKNQNTGLVTDMGPLTISTNKWCRLEFRGLLSTTVGSADLRYYGDDDVDTNNITASCSQTGQNYNSTSATNMMIGEISGATPNIPSMYYSNWQVNTTDWPGPAPFRQGLGAPSGNLTNPIAIHSAVD
jgi:hypothetical protein